MKRSTQSILTDIAELASDHEDDYPEGAVAACRDAATRLDELEDVLPALRALVAYNWADEARGTSAAWSATAPRPPRPTAAPR